MLCWPQLGVEVDELGLRYDLGVVLTRLGSS